MHEEVADASGKAEPQVDQQDPQAKKRSQVQFLDEIFDQSE